MAEPTIEDAIAAVCQAARARTEHVDAEGRVEVLGETVYGVLTEQGVDQQTASDLTREAVKRLNGKSAPHTYRREGLGPNYGRVEQTDVYLVPLERCQE